MADNARVAGTTVPTAVRKRLPAFLAVVLCGMLLGIVFSLRGGAAFAATSTFVVQTPQLDAGTGAQGAAVSPDRYVNDQVALFELDTLLDAAATLAADELRTQARLRATGTVEVNSGDPVVLGRNGSIQLRRSDRRVAVEADGVQLDTVSETVDDEGAAQLSATLVKFAKLGLLDQLMHTVASPPVAYLMIVIGLALLVFELFTAGVGVAGVVGAACTFLGCYGLAALPVRGWAIGLLVLAFVAYSVDVQVGIPRFWTGVGIFCTVLGSWFLFRPLPGTDLRIGWLTLVVGVGGLMLTYIVGMPSMVRTRFATPTIGREWMIGELGTAVGDVAPDGLVTVSGARWRARTNRSTPLHAGDTVRVVAIDGVTLEVEPETGGARDYRERRRSGGGNTIAEG